VMDDCEVVEVLVTVTVLTDGGEVEDEDTDVEELEDEDVDDGEVAEEDAEVVGEEVEDEDDVLVTFAIDAGRIYESAVMLKTAPGSSNELGAVGQSAIFCELYAQMKSG
jgi:hypothetical protein